MHFSLFFPTVESALLFYRTWFFIFCWLDPLLQDPVLLFCYGWSMQSLLFSLPTVKILAAAIMQEEQFFKSPYLSIVSAKKWPNFL